MMKLAERLDNIDSNTHCKCGNAFPVHPPGYCGGTGYAITKDGEKICYPCADKHEVESLKDRSKPFVAYLSGRHVTTWTGGVLMVVQASTPCKLTRPSFAHDQKSFRSVHCVDVHGQHWTGRGSDGIAIKLRPVN